MMTSKLPIFIGIRSISKVSGLMTHFVASPTLDSANSCVMQGASCTQRKVSCLPFVFSILFVLSRGGSISPDSFLPSILLLVVIIVMVIVTVVVVVAVGGVPSILKLSFMVIGWANEFHQNKASSLHFLATGASLGLVFLFGLSVLAMV
ncbi:hypothetical protein Tco_1574856, partial [Tanacetum coccineum]